MYMTDCYPTRVQRAPVICPACGASDYNDDHIALPAHRAVFREADGLVQEGRTGEAIDLLSALYARHIANFVRPRWRCRCGVKFSG